MPAGSPHRPPRDSLTEVGMVHAMDPDGSSLCATVAAGLLAPVDSFKFTDASRQQRCLLCESILGL